MAGESLVILFHGVAAFGHDLAPLREALRQSLPRASFAAPNAPFPFAHGPGRQWYSQDGISAVNRPARVAAARPAFDDLLRDILEDRDFDRRLDRVALVGFSQGAIMVLDALASGRWPVAAVVAFSGRLSSPPPLAPSLSTSLLLVHGVADPVVPPQESDHAFTVLRGLGVRVERRFLPGVGHVVAPEGMALATAFLDRVLYGRRAES
ncbi:alpha/beta hydrolase [Labrys monachus]|nr:prolyl oligopeptidase family serine peptidase [Labrys monachus]